MQREDLELNRDEPMPPQQSDWTCSACSLAWGLRALSLWNDCTEADAVDAIGTPDNINSAVGLVDGSGNALATVVRRYGVSATTCWPDWDTLCAMTAKHALLIGGLGWYHWVGVRSAELGTLYIANSAPGWMGVFGELYPDDCARLGPFAAVVIPLVRVFPSGGPN